MLSPQTELHSNTAPPPAGAVRIHARGDLSADPAARRCVTQGSSRRIAAANDGLA
jgi:hypothetical protein